MVVYLTMEQGDNVRLKSALATAPLRAFGGRFKALFSISLELTPDKVGSPIGLLMNVPVVDQKSSYIEPERYDSLMIDLVARGTTTQIWATSRITEQATHSASRQKVRLSCKSLNYSFLVTVL